MARFLPETIESVLGQDYPHVEYLVIDGGSRDSTREVLARYGSRLRWISEPDQGQADAVNKGFALARGEIFTFINADDTYATPHAISLAVEALNRAPEAAVVYGDACYISENGQVLGRYPVEPYDAHLLATQCYICQPASFIRSRVFDEIGRLDTALHLTLDYDLWLRVAARYPMKKIDHVLARSRMYPSNKTLGRRGEWFAEIIRITRRHCGYVPLNYVYGYAGYRLHGDDGFFRVSPPSVIKYLFTLALGARFNGTRFPRFLGECLGSAGLAAGMLWKKWLGGAQRYTDL